MASQWFYDLMGEQIRPVTGNPGNPGTEIHRKGNPEIQGHNTSYEKMGKMRLSMLSKSVLCPPIFVLQDEVNPAT